MSFYASNSKPDWICSNPECRTSNPHSYLICFRCFTPRQDEDESNPAASHFLQCGYCSDAPGDNLRCPVHGVVVNK